MLERTIPIVAVFCISFAAQGQGTMTVTFEGQPYGTASQVGPYSSGGLRFLPIAPGSLYLSGGGIPGYPDNGSGYLYTPDNGIWFGPDNSFPTTTPFSLITFGAAEYAGSGPSSLTVVGYIPMAGTVTNIFSLDGINDGVGPLHDFQTFSLSSSFVGLYKVEIYGHFSIDNMVVSGVPEPSTGSLALVGASGAIAWSRFRRNRRIRQTNA